MRDRGGKSGIGCLGSIILIVSVAYFGARFIPPYIAYEQFRDEMKSDARFATTLTDSAIRVRLVAQADTLGLPPEAKRIVIRRRGGRPPTITISADYAVKVNVPIFGIKVLHFKPTAEEPI
jgi:hypothetical protein